MGSSLMEKVARAKRAGLLLSQTPRRTRDHALNSAAKMLLEKKEEILKANSKDIAAARAQLAEGKLSKSLLDRLELDQAKLTEISKMIESVAKLDDPVGKTVYAVKLDSDLDLFKITVPFGLIASIFESRPDALPQIASLCLKSGNAVLLKGGSEAQETNRSIFQVMSQAFASAGVPDGSMVLMEGRAAIAEILKMEGTVDLIIPRGSNEFVRHIQKSTRIPVLGHSSGICHIYVESTADHEKAVEICHDARVQYPAACNSMKVLLIDDKIAPVLLPKIASRLVGSGVKLKGCKETVKLLSARGIPVEPAQESDYHHEYLELILPIKVVKGIDEAVAHINRHGSKHTDSIISEDAKAVKTFLNGVDSSTVVRNASTRFSDGYRYGLGAEVGISTNKIHARGPVGLEGLVTTKYVLLGSGQRVLDYAGKGARPFLHEKIDGKWEERLK
jgi:glutamate-5-semialdehyde dehydrogenase